MIMNLLFGILPDLIGGAFFYGAMYWAVTKLDAKFSGRNEEQLKSRRSEVRWFLSFGFCVFVLFNIWSTWHTYGYRVEAQPSGKHQMQYEPQRTEIESGKKFIDSEDRRGDFHNKAK